MLFVMSIGSVWAENQTLNLDASEATYINAGNPDTNYSSAEELYANFSKISGGKLTDQLSAYGGSDITIIKFNASSLPAGATVISANVTFNSACTVSGKNSQLAIVPINTSWSAATATWSNVDLSANGANVVSLAYSPNSTSAQTYDAKNVLIADDDKILSFAIFTNTGRQQKVSDFKLSIVYTEEVIPEHNYTVNADCAGTVLAELATGTAFQNDNYSVNGLPYGITKSGVVYILDDANVSGYSKEFTMGTADETKTVSYRASDYAYFFEAEAILSKSYGNSNGGYSAGTTAGVYTGANLTMTGIANGIYNITVNSSVRRSNEDIFRVETSADGTAWTEVGTITLTSNVGGNYSIENVAVNGYVRLVEAKSQNMCHYVDYVIIEKVSSYKRATATNDYGTICLPYAFTATGATIYSAAVSGDEVALTEVTTPVAGTPYIYQATADAQTFEFVGAPVAAPVAAEPLVGVFAATDVPVGSYVLQNQGDGQKFYVVADGKQPTLSANKAYLTVASSARELNIAEEATAIKAVNALVNGDAKIYDINGRELNSLQKGINIVNGVKVLVK